MGITKGTVRFFERENQSTVAAKCQDYFALLNSLVICAFMVDGCEMSFSAVRDLFNALTGWGYTIEDLMEAGERIFTVQRLINLRDGYSHETDALPQKMFKTAREGFRANRVLPFEDLMKDYYRLRGWDATGRPLEETLSRLGLVG